jgi:Protein of unknown function (DUF1360)
MVTADWYALILLALAAFRVWRLLAVDMVLDGPRERLPKSWAWFVDCPWCLGFWVSLGWWAGYQLWPHAALVVAVPFAVSTLVGLLWDALP